jgi:hypothetical protein
MDPAEMELLTLLGGVDEAVLSKSFSAYYSVVHEPELEAESSSLTLAAAQSDNALQPPSLYCHEPATCTTLTDSHAIVLPCSPRALLARLCSARQRVASHITSAHRTTAWLRAQLALDALTARRSYDSADSGMGAEDGGYGCSPGGSLAAADHLNTYESEDSDDVVYEDQTPVVPSLTALGKAPSFVPRLQLSPLTCHASPASAPTKLNPGNLSATSAACRSTSSPASSISLLGLRVV